MAIRFLDEEPKSKIKFLDEEPQEEIKPTFTQQELEERGERFGAIKEPPTLIERIPRTLPSTGQFIGGLLGGVGGARVGMPFKGAAAGGVVGRTIGAAAEQTIEAGQEALQRIIRDPQQTLRGFVTPKPVTDLISPLGKKRTGRVAQEAFSASVTEAIAAPLAVVPSKLGKNLVEAIVGKRAAQRGFEVGFKKLTNPKFFQGRVPKAIAEKTGQFFNRLTKVTGQGTDDAINALEGKTRFTASAPIKQGVRDVEKLLGKVDDLGVEVPNQQKKLIKEFLNDIDRLAKRDPLTGITPKNILVRDVWKTRRKGDEIFFNRSLAPAAKEYFEKLRPILNNPIKTASPDVSKQFGRYSFVKQLQREEEKDFATRTVDGKIFARRPERFAANLLSTAKDEEIRELKQLDSFLNIDERVIEDLLDVAAAEQLDKPIQFLGLPSRLIAGSRIRFGTAQAAQAFQSPGVQIPTKAIGRTIPTIFSEALSPERE